MPVHRASGRLTGSSSGRVRYPLFDVPVMLFTGLWLLVMSWDAGGVQGLIFPGVMGWVLIMIALLRVVFRRLRRGAVMSGPSYRRALLWIWVICALAFAVAAGGELFVSRLMPDAWRQSLVKTLHIRRVYRNYGP
jgi:hypothetical protein